MPPGIRVKLTPSDVVACSRERERQRLCLLFCMVLTLCISQSLCLFTAGKSAKKGNATPATLSGSYIFPNGDKYEGEYVEKGPGHIVRNGRGTHTSASGMVYSGQWTSDILNGRGEVHYPTGANYKGEIVDGEYHGDGIYTWPDGSSFSGPFLHNKMEGRGEFTDSSGRHWVGEFSGHTAEKLRLEIRN